MGLDWAERAPNYWFVRQLSRPDVLSQHQVADLERFDRSLAALGPHHRPAREAGHDLRLGKSG